MSITLALSKGRIFDETLPLLEAAGIAVLEDPDTSRKLDRKSTRLNPVTSLSRMPSSA